MTPLTELQSRRYKQNRVPPKTFQEGMAKMESYDGVSTYQDTMKLKHLGIPYFLISV